MFLAGIGFQDYSMDMNQDLVCAVDFSPGNTDQVGNKFIKTGDQKFEVS